MTAAFRCYRIFEIALRRLIVALHKYRAAQVNESAHREMLNPI